MAIAPGATRTATFTYDIAADSPCEEGWVVEFFFYSYWEFGGSADDVIVLGGPATNVVC